MLSLTSPVRTPFHTVPPAAKLAVLCLTTLALFRMTDVVALSVVLAVVAFLYAICGKVFFVTGVRRLSPVWVFFLVVTTWHIATDEISAGLAILLRMTAIIALANLVTMTTKMDALIDVATGLLKPCRRFGLKPEIIGFSVGLVVRFIPVLLAKYAAISLAWKAKSPRRANWRILFPIFLTTLDDAEHVADALRARGGLQAMD